MHKPRSLLHIAYLVTIAVKGFDGAIELLIGLLILIAGPIRLYLFVLRLTAPELDDHPTSRVLHAIRAGASNLAFNQEGFAVTYLLIHGVLKLGLAVALLRGGHRWIYPVGACILISFILFMSFRLAAHWSDLLFGFVLFDLLTLLLVLNEWRQPAGHASKAAPASRAPAR
jgi:uncharacterized membrane protein